MADADLSAEITELSKRQKLSGKSRIIKSTFSAHNRHVSSGSIKETLNSKQDVSSKAGLAELIDELGFEIVELKVTKETETNILDNVICLFEDGALALRLRKIMT